MATRKPRLKIVPLSKAPRELSALIYGRSGTGKTWFSATFPKPLLIACIGERGTDTILNVEDVEYTEIEDFGTLEDLYYFLKNDSDYATVVLDQVTALQNLIVKEFQQGRKTKTSSGPHEGITRKDWGNISGKLLTWLGRFRDLPLNTVFIGHERAFTPEEAEEGQIEPSIGVRLMPSVSTFLEGAVDFVGNTFIRETFEKDGHKEIRVVEYCLRVGPHAYYTTKIRRPPDTPLPEYLVDPTYSKVVRLIRPQKPKRKCNA